MQGKLRQTEARRWCHKHTRVMAVVRTGLTTQVEVALRVGNLTIHGNGLTRCGPSDEDSLQRGIDIARGRASKAVAEQLVRTEMSPWAYT